jgi:arylsulfatase A-like enzyme
MPDWEKRLRPGIPTLVSLMRQQRYATASIGKWHLGGDDCRPERHGFDVNLAGTDKGQPPSYFAPYRIATLPDGTPGEYLTDRLTTEATRFIARHRDQPFLLYLPHFAVHNPIQARPELVAKYRAKAKPGDFDYKPAYAAMIESVDDSVGRLMSTLDELKLTDRTVFVFTSDNGGLMANTPTAPLRGGKGSAYEGGVRVPLIVRWPGVARPGATVNEPAITQDIFWTVLDAAGVAAPAEVPRDGESLRGVLAGRPSRTDRALFWHYPHYQTGWNSPYSAVRSGDWRLIEFLETRRCELYHLRADPGEKADLSGSEPAKAAGMLEMLNRWRSSVGAQMPTPNPDYDPTRDAPTGKAKGRAPA